MCPVAGFIYGPNGDSHHYKESLEQVVPPGVGAPDGIPTPPQFATDGTGE